MIRLNLNQSGELGLEQAATETGEPCDSDKDFELSPPQKKRKAMTKPSSAKKTKNTRYRGGNYSTEEITSLLQLIEDALPISSSEWETLARLHFEKIKKMREGRNFHQEKNSKSFGKKECLLGIPIALLISEKQNKSC